MKQFFMSARSYWIGLRASRRLGRVIKLRDAGKTVQALACAQGALALLRDPVVQRTEPAEGSVLLCLTVNTEQLAHVLGRQGADPEDVKDALHYLRDVGMRGGTKVQGFRAAWLPYLEARMSKHVVARNEPH